MKVGVTIPAFNEAKLILKTLKNIPSYVDSVVVVDDGSTDGTFSKANNYKDKRVSVIHQANTGVGSAIKKGHQELIENGCEVLIVMAGDNQMNPDYLIEILELYCKSNDKNRILIKGDRLSKKNNQNNMPRMRLFGNLILTKIYQHLFQEDVFDPLNGYTCINSIFYNKILKLGLVNGYTYEIDLLCKINLVGGKIIDVPMESIYGEAVSSMKQFRTFLCILVILFKNYFYTRRQLRGYLHQE